MAGGALGSGLRFALGLAFPQTPGRFPLTTLLINLTGSFLLGLVNALAVRTTMLNRELTVFLGAGLCGGFTTFSTFSAEMLSLWELDRTWMLLAYAATSLLGGLAAAALGVAVGTSFTR